MIFQETIFCWKNPWFLKLCRSQSNALISDVTTNWFKDFGPQETNGEPKPELDAEMSSCVCDCGLNKWHLVATNWLHTQERTNNWVNEICRCLFTHQFGFSVERHVIIPGPGEAFLEDRIYTRLRNHVCFFYSMIVKLNISCIYLNSQEIHQQTS